jgi:serine protease DegQ
MNDRRPSVVWRLWLLIAQVIAISAAVLIAWKAFGPAPVAPARTEVVAVREAPLSDGAASAPNGKSVATRLEAGFRAAAAKASASVVNIYTRKAPPRPLPGSLRPYGESDEEAAQGQSSLGSGVIVAAQGSILMDNHVVEGANFILTNNHVVEGAHEIAVMLPGGQVAEARIVGTDPETDLAVLRVEGRRLRPITFADPASVQVGDIVLAVGDPFGVGQTVTQGIVSATGRNRLGINTFENFIQTDAAINPGNSGGALVDTSGHLVGINTAIYSRSGGSQGIGFAIPVSLARQVLEQIIATGRVSRGWLGVSARDVIHETTGAAAGAALVAVQRGGPADRAGLRAGDTVISINGKEIGDTAALINETAALSPGSKAQFKVLRGHEAMALAVVLGQRPVARRQ